MDSTRAIKPFDAKGENLAVEWRKWKRSLEYYLEASNVVGQRERKNLLLHLGGPELQDIFDSLPGVHEVPHVAVDPPFYDVAIEKLDAHFQPIQRRTYERHIFRQITQQNGERFNDFVMKLRVQASRCDFDQDGGSVRDSMIIDQIAEKCLSSALRKKILEKDRPLSEVVAIGKTIEDVEMQCKELVSSNKEPITVNRVDPSTQQNPDPSSFRGHQSWSFKSPTELRNQYARGQWRPSQFGNRRETFEQSRQTNRFSTKPTDAYPRRNEEDNRICFGCGRRGHAKGSERCPAKQAQCLRCRRPGHFAKWCTKRLGSDCNDAPPSKRIKVVYETGKPTDTEKKDEDICYVMGQNTFKFTVGGVEIPMAIDSGAAANLVDDVTWKKLSAAGANVQFQPEVDRTFKAYGSEKPLEMTGKFTAEIQAGKYKTIAVFYIAKNGRQCLLGDETAKLLNVLKIGYNINSVRSSGFPKIKGIVVEIPIDPSVKPIQQPYRRVPFALEPKIAEKLQYLLNEGIIEQVNEPSAWVSPIVPIVKDSGEVRLCVDMRRANSAVMRETHPLPIVEELFSGIDGAVRFSKLDIKEAYHQVEISERSRGITTFITKQGLFR